MGVLARRRLGKWTKRSQPHLEQFNHALDIIAAATPTNLVGVGDQLAAAVADIADYFAADPCPQPELAVTYATVVAIITSLADIFASWQAMPRVERQEAVERTHALGVQASEVAWVLGPAAGR